MWALCKRSSESGRHLVLCNGYIVAGPQWKSLLGTIVLLLIPAGLFLGFVAPDIGRRVSWAIPAVSAWMVVFVFVMLFLTAFLDPGIIPRQPTSPLFQVYQQADREYHVSGYTIRVKWCSTCNHYRPPRCVHCAICDNCIDKFDHHCPWVGTCIGKRNYRFYLLFIQSTSFMILWGFGWSLANIILYASEHNVGAGAAIRGEPISLALMIYGVLGLLFIGMLTGFHLYLCGTNKTTYEHCKHRFNQGNPYSKGILKNCSEAFCSPIPPRHRMANDVETPGAVLTGWRAVSGNNSGNNRRLTQELNQIWGRADSNATVWHHSGGNQSDISSQQSLAVRSNNTNSTRATFLAQHHSQHNSLNSLNSTQVNSLNSLNSTQLNSLPLPRVDSAHSQQSESTAQQYTHTVLQSNPSLGAVSAGLEAVVVDFDSFTLESPAASLPTELRTPPATGSEGPNSTPPASSNTRPPSQSAANSRNPTLTGGTNSWTPPQSTGSGPRSGPPSGPGTRNSGPLEIHVGHSIPEEGGHHHEGQLSYRRNSALERGFSLTGCLRLPSTASDMNVVLAAVPPRPPEPALAPSASWHTANSEALASDTSLTHSSLTQYIPLEAAIMKSEQGVSLGNGGLAMETPSAKVGRDLTSGASVGDGKSMGDAMETPFAKVGRDLTSGASVGDGKSVGDAGDSTDGEGCTNATSLSQEVEGVVVLPQRQAAGTAGRSQEDGDSPGVGVSGDAQRTSGDARRTSGDARWTSGDAQHTSGDAQSLNPATASSDDRPAVRQEQDMV